MKQLISAFLVSIMLFSTTGFSKTVSTVCDEFLSPEIQAAYDVKAYNEQGACVIEEAALEYVEAAAYVGEVQDEAQSFLLYETARSEYGLFVVQADQMTEEGIIPLAVVLTAIAVDFGIITGMYAVYAGYIN